MNTTYTEPTDLQWLMKLKAINYEVECDVQHACQAIDKHVEQKIKDWRKEIKLSFYIRVQNNWIYPHDEYYSKILDILPKLRF